MQKCNNCTKFLTCNREYCKPVTYLQANQIERIGAKEEKEEIIPATGDLLMLRDLKEQQGLIKNLLETEEE